MKASEKQGLCKKITTVLKKRYKKPLPDTDRPVLDILLYAICLENVSVSEAEASFERLMADFYDYNELRVSSLTEIESAFNGAEQSEFRALRVRTVLQDVFENLYTFDFEALRKKTLDAATKQLDKLRHLSDFVRDFALQTALGAHVVPVDDRMKNAAVWLGLAPADATASQAGDALKPALRKADAPLFCHLLRCLATDSAFVKTFETAVRKPPTDGFDPDTAVDRLNDLIKSGGKKSRSSKRKTAKKSSRKSTRKSTGTKRSAAKKKSKKRTAKKGSRSSSKKTSKQSLASK